MTDKTISAEQVAILAERVDVQNLNHARFEGLLVGISNQQNEMLRQMSVLNEQMRRFDENKARLFSITEEQHKRMDAIESDVRVHSWTWKLIGGCVSIALAVAGYTFNEFREINRDAANIDRRMTLIEFIVGGRTNYPAQKTEAAK